MFKLERRTFNQRSVRLAAVVGTEGLSQINIDDKNNNNNNSTKIQLHGNCDPEEHRTVGSRSARCSEMFAVGFFNASIGSWDPVERLKPTVLHELMEPTRGSQRKQMDFVCERRREPRAVPGWPLPVKAQMLEEG